MNIKQVNKILKKYHYKMELQQDWFCIYKQGESTPIIIITKDNQIEFNTQIFLNGDIAIAISKFLRTPNKQRIEAE